MQEVTDDLRAAAVAHARQLGGRKQRLRDRPVPAAEAAAVADARSRGAEGRQDAGRRCRRPSTPSRPPPASAIDDGLADERAVFQRLRVSREAFALRHQFFAERDSAKHPSLDGAMPRVVQRIAVIGAGTMGSGIAIAALDAGYEVLLLEQAGRRAGTRCRPHPRALCRPRAGAASSRPPWRRPARRG